MKSKIIYEDADILVCYKESGLAVQSKKVTQKDMESELKSYLKRGNGSGYLGVVHRLDQPVAGVMVFAKNPSAAKVLSEQFSNGTAMHKIYEATIFGHMLEKEGHLIDYILTDKLKNTSTVVKAEIKGAKRAELDYKVLSETESTDTLEIRLLTGRHHQIRVQLASAGHPIVGDLKYGSEESIEYSKINGVRFIRLTALRLIFKHPTTGRELMFAAEDSRL